MPRRPTTEATTRAERVREASRLRREQEKEELRQAILKAAAELFVAEGYAGFSLRKVAERIGYSATTIYLYFQDKDDLLFTVVDQGFDRFAEAIEAAARSTEDPLERILAIGRAYVQFGLDYPAHYELMFVQRCDFLVGKRPGENRPRIEAFQATVDAIRLAMEAGVIRQFDVQECAIALWAAVHGLVALAIKMPAMVRPNADQAYGVIQEIIRQGLAAS